jgi:hypothetical protein
VNPDLALATMPPDLAVDMGPDMTSTVPPIVPPAPFWVCSGGGAVVGMQSGARLNLSVGGSVASGRSVSVTSPAAVRFGYLSEDAIDK